MKALLTLVLLSTSFIPAAFAEDGKWETVRCSYKRNRIPDDDRGTWCRHFFTCVDQGKRAYIFYTEGSMDRFCCDSAKQSCTPAYNGS